MKNLKKIIIFTILLISNCIFMVTSNKTEAKADQIDDFLRKYGAGNSYVDNGDGHIYWLTAGNTASSSSTMGFCSVGLCVTIGRYTIEFVEPCVEETKKT